LITKRAQEWLYSEVVFAAVAGRCIGLLLMPQAIPTLFGW
jgi:hypothetical protein